ncbi:hypothetical protein [Massilia sp. DD77]|uniref:hypothetical protein n=1 Tax=Massilia sp. DD77 TaxID=3109349 RepID=UPI002FFF483F
MNTAIKELSIEEVNQVAGAVTQKQCVAIATAAGGWFGAFMVGAETAGFGSWAGFVMGSQIGGAVGAVGCAYIYE